MSKQIYQFREGDAGMKHILGGKGAGLAEMVRAGLPVPPGFVISTDACRLFYQQGNTLTLSLLKELEQAMAELEQALGLNLGDPERPLLVSVRSGAVVSMPGMMDTILNLGLNDSTVEGLAAGTGNKRQAYNCYRRLIQMFGHVVLGLDNAVFEVPLERIRVQAGASCDQELTGEHWAEAAREFKLRIAELTGREFPQDVRTQLRMAVEAVFRSWNNPRAQVYRKLHHISDEQGTAVTIQAMVLGNKGADSGTGVLFTRNPNTGGNELFGEYLPDAQGEDVVAGDRTPYPLSELKERLPAIYEQLQTAAVQLEKHCRDMQDIEFTVEAGRLFLLQTRSGKRTAQAAMRIAVDMVHEGTINKAEAVMRIESTHLDSLLHRSLGGSAIAETIGRGLPASPGAAAGQLVFDADTAAEWALQNRKVILARSETVPEDIRGVAAAEGLLTLRGGMTSHAAVVARGMGTPCVCGCAELRIDQEAKQLTTGSITLKEGDWITLDGTTGIVIAGQVPLREAEATGELSTLLEWADEFRKLRILANADSPKDAAEARKWGAEGIGLCRTEHMFFSSARLPVVQEMIAADTVKERQSALAKLLPMQQWDFEEIFMEMKGKPVAIRLLDPPLHEFLPAPEELAKRIEELADHGDPAAYEERTKLVRLAAKTEELREVNPMMGHRGCRLGILHPQIYEMQVEAIFRAAVRVINRNMPVRPEIIIPLVGHRNELLLLRRLIDSVAAQVLGNERRNSCPYKVGTMIEVPRAALTAAQLAEHADFFSFGTNDLTQLTFGFSRDDAEKKFLSYYVDQKLLPRNPFTSLDEEGVGKLMEYAVQAGVSVRPSLKKGLCGEHSGDLDSVLYCHRIGLDYISCSPRRIPQARIAAAQAALLHTSSEAPQNQPVTLITKPLQ